MLYHYGAGLQMDWGNAMQTEEQNMESWGGVDTEPGPFPMQTRSKRGRA